MKVSYKQITAILIIGFFLTSVCGSLVSIIDNKPFDIYIRITEKTCPPPSEYTLQSEVDVGYFVPMVCEIWNPSEITYIYHTQNLNLIDPQMEIKLKKDYPIWASYTIWFFPNTHEIKPGVTEKEAGLTISVRNYNDSIPPAGTYTTWVGIVDEPELHGEPPFTFKSYKTVLKKYRFGYTINSEATPWNWDQITSFKYRLVAVLLWAFSGGELVAVIVFWRKNRKAKLKH
jgi:hypothetical protein